MNQFEFYDAFEFAIVLAIAETLLFASRERRSSFAVRLACAVIAYAAIVYGLYAISATYLSGWLGLLRYLLIFAASIAALLVCLDEAIQTVLFLAVAAYAIQHCSVSVTMVAAFFVPAHGGLWMITQSAVCVVLGLIFRKIFDENGRQVLADGQLLGITVTILLITLVMSYIPVLYLEREDSLEKSICGMYAAVSCILALALQSGLLTQNRWKDQALLVQQMWNMNRHQYELSKTTIETINVRSHDLKKQIGLLRDAYLNNEAGRALDSIESAVSQYDVMAKSGNANLDVILTDKLIYAKRNGISMTHLVDGREFTFMETIDLYALFGNMLDNAFEEVMRIADSRRRVVVLNGMRSGGMVVIRCENPTASPLNLREGELPDTTKSDVSSHGFGLRSIRMVAEKYGGHMTLESDGELFCISVIIPATPTSPVEW